MNDKPYDPRIEGKRFVVGSRLNPTRIEAHFANRTFRCYRNRPKHFDALLRAAAATSPDCDALVSRDRRLTYAEFDQAVTRVANGLLGAGIAAGDRIGVMQGNSVSFFLSMMGAIRMGAIAVPMSVKMSPVEAAYILNHCRAQALICEEAVLDRLPDFADCPSVREVWIDSDRVPEGMTSFTALSSATDTPVEPVGDEDDTIFLFYTSGTTGKPKGACITNLNMVHSALHYRYAIDLKSGQRGLLAIPGAHISGFFAVFTNMLSVAGATVLMRDYKTAAVLDTMKRERITFTVFVPAIYQLILMHEDFDARELKDWRYAIYGGGIMPGATVTRLNTVLPDLLLINAYGATETTSPVSIMPAWASADRPDSIGLLVECGEAVVMGEDGREVEPGAVGELWIRGPMVVPGYWEAPDQTNASFTDGFWHTGDVVSMDEDGFLYIHDRTKDMINRGGYKVFSAEVENVIIALDGVIECAAVPVPDTVMGERVCLFVRVQDTGIAEETLRKHAGSALSDYKLPDFYVISDAPLPRNANGKIMKAPLAEEARRFENAGR